MKFDQLPLHKSFTNCNSIRQVSVQTSYIPEPWIAITLRRPKKKQGLLGVVVDVEGGIGRYGMSYLREVVVIHILIIVS